MSKALILIIVDSLIGWAKETREGEPKQLRKYDDIFEEVNKPASSLCGLVHEIGLKE